eukprot:CAMPEP_0197035444 /NCGR_PEP_ID=MMETSP1384-20130603/13245_1 /TAXON_ID=29189 /ORGANISM="Ammonia sp." /LENGTH=495 /DNA_ID=CAMNT_0042465511 /DNA_START=111 /DNA_END=1598 /DNA_ORIENTATION=+
MVKPNLDELTVGTSIELLWPPSGQWQTGTITHVWGNGEFAIQFEDDPFDEPLSYRLESYEFRVLSAGTGSNGGAIKKETATEAEQVAEKELDGDGDEEMKTKQEPASQENEDGNGEEVAEPDPVDEIEAIIDYVYNDNEEYGELFNVYRIKWKNVDLAEATWEPKDHLADAAEMIERYNKQIAECNPNASNIRNVRKSPFDNNLLHDLWNLLSEVGVSEDNEYGFIWQSEGRAFQILDEEKFIKNFLSRNKHTMIDENKYDSFSDRMTVLGFEQEKDAKLYHHPCFNSKSSKLIDFVGKNSLPLPNDDEKAALFKSRVLKEKQQQIHPVMNTDLANTDVMMDNMSISGRKRKERPSTDVRQATVQKHKQQKQKAAAQQQQAPGQQEMNSYNYGLFVPIESELDLNQAHTWTEHEVAQWIRWWPDWGNYYALKFMENGVDGRMLLEFDDLDLVMSECQIQNAHKATLIYGVNQLRAVRKSSLLQMRKVQKTQKRAQ